MINLKQNVDQFDVIKGLKLILLTFSFIMNPISR